MVILRPPRVQEALIKQKETNKKKQVPPSSSSFVVSLCPPLVAEPDVVQLAKLSHGLPSIMEASQSPVWRAGVELCDINFTPGIKRNLF